MCADELVIDVGPTETAAQKVVNGLCEAKEQDIYARQTVDEDASHEEAKSANYWAAQNVPQRGRFGVVNLLDCRPGHDDALEW
jgi:hypothetical protein